MAGTYKSISVMRQITEGLKRRLSTWTFTSGVEATTNSPILIISSGAAVTTTLRVATIRVSPVTNLFTNGIGGTQDTFCPHYVEMCSESGTGGNLASSSYLTVADQTAIFGELMKVTGIFVSYQTANATPPSLATTATQMVAANQVASFVTDASWLLGAV